MKVIFFDGYCGLCNGFIDFIIKVDKRGQFKFSPLQSEYAKANLSDCDVTDLKSVVVLIDGKIYRKAEGVFKALSSLGGVWKMSALIGSLHSGILNAGYDLVAENRYRIFGKRETCRLPNPEERSRFIL
jgi:predicted DCC family thiol-disulfide oxidoreductase YuxK